MAGRKKQEIKVYHMISFDGPNGDYKPLEECTEEEREKFIKGVSKVQSKFFSEYYSNHIDEYVKFLEGQGIDPYAAVANR